MCGFGNPWLKKVFYLFLYTPTQTYVFIYIHVYMYIHVCVHIYTCLKFYLPPASMFNKIILVLLNTAYSAELQSLN